MSLSEEDRLLIAEYVIEHDRCAVCHTGGRPWNPLEVHHIAGRSSREGAHSHPALLRLCRECHTGYHSGGGCNLTLGHILWAKQDEDWSVDVEFLAWLKGRKGLREDPQELPKWALDARIDNAQKGKAKWRG